MPLPSSKLPLNQILYGPPGTGKTFRVVREAVKIIEPTFIGDFKTRFEELRAAGRIGFVTFHQSFSYEEFIEGLRPVLDDENGQARYEIRDGVLKTMALAAIDDAVAYIGTFASAWAKLLDELSQEEPVFVEYPLGNNFEIKLDGLQVVGRRCSKKSDVFDLECSEPIAEQVWRDTLHKVLADRADVKRSVNQTGVNADFITAVINEMAAVVHNKPTSSGKRWLEGNAGYGLWDQEIARHVLIIDEINRGNISKILGELITLLEDDKRLGAANELRLTLPVSGETFALPPNLFILGTMNTADRSLAQLDVALRRRFSFLEMVPDFGVCEGLPDEMRRVLERLNERIEWAIDREHRLGHAAWMGVRTPDDFNDVWREKVMPLLVELFADNLEGLREVLGDGDNQSGFVRPFKAPDGMKGRARLRLYSDCSDAASFDALATLTRNLGVA